MEVDAEAGTSQIVDQQMDQGNAESSDEASDGEICNNPQVSEIDFKMMSETIEQIKDCHYFKVFYLFKF